MAQRRLTADDWSRAALAAMASAGLAAVAVEPLAASMNATKGGFYRRFANRDALIMAMLELWERTATEAVIATVETAADPADKLRTLLRTVWGPEHAADGRLDTNMLAAADHPLVGPVVERVSRRRIEYTAGLLREAGVDPTEAHRRATLNYTAFVGHAVLSARMPALMPRDPDQLDQQIETVLAVLLAGTATGHGGDTPSRSGRRAAPRQAPSS